MKSQSLLTDGRYELRQDDRVLVVAASDLEAASADFFHDEPSPVPQSVTPLQMRKALRHSGLKPVFDAFIATLAEEVIEEWEYALSIDRDNPTLLMAAEALGMSIEQVDDLFRVAASQ